MNPLDICPHCGRFNVNCRCVIHHAGFLGQGLCLALFRDPASTDLTAQDWEGVTCPGCLGWHDTIASEVEAVLKERGISWARP